MGRHFAALKAVSLVKSAGADIVNRGPQPKPPRHQLLGTLEQSLTDPLPLRAGRDENLIETFAFRLQGEKAEQFASFVLGEIERPTTRYFALDPLAHGGLAGQLRDSQSGRTPALKPQMRSGVQIAVFVGSDRDVHVSDLNSVGARE